MEDRVKKRQGALSRRTFVKAGAASALTAASWRRVYGANERIGVGMIGYGLIGQPHLEDLREQPDVDMIAVAEAHRGRMEQAAAACGREVEKYRDFRKLLENKNVDAVVISTPDHWHGLMAMMACAAGKDVYVEKPMTLFVREGRWMSDVARRHKRVVQVGTQQRSGPHYAHARKLVQEGHIGKLVSVQFHYHRNLMPGFPSPPDTDPPPDLDWNMFLGPAPMRPYNVNRGIYQFRWFWDYSGGQMTNWGQHGMDIAFWFTGVKGPNSVVSIGGRRFLKDNCETPDLQDTIFEFSDPRGENPDWSHVISIRDCSRGYDIEESRGDMYYGTKGSLRITRAGFQVTPDPMIPPMNLMPGVLDGHPVGGPKPVRQEGEPKPRTEALRDKGDARQLLKLHVRNFLDCIKSRETPVSDVESGHQVATTLHLANLSLRLNRPLRWDIENETVVGDKEAAAMLVRPYRKPWDAELRALGVS